MIRTRYMFLHRKGDRYVFACQRGPMAWGLHECPVAKFWRRPNLALESQKGAAV